MKNKKSIWFLVGAIIAFSAYASSPASTDYVNAKIAIMQAEILEILNNR